MKTNTQNNTNINSATVKKNKISVRCLVAVAALSAVAYLLQLLGTVMPFKIGGFLEIEFSDLPAIIASFALGPIPGVLTELLKNIFKCSMSTTGFVGELANFAVNGIYVFTAGMIYKYKKNKIGAVIALICATFVMTAAGVLTNMFIMLPMYMPATPAVQLLTIVLSVITPFNLIKGATLAVITFFIYKPLSPIIKGRK